VFYGHATVYFIVEFDKEVAASKGMHVGKLMASSRRKVSLADAVHVAHANKILRVSCPLPRKVWMPLLYLL
jgi:hypothetical protein